MHEVVAVPGLASQYEHSGSQADRKKSNKIENALKERCENMEDKQGRVLEG